MIGFLEGILEESGPFFALVNVGGVGYEVHIPLTTAEKLPAPGQRVRLLTVAVYREDAATLYGFVAREDRDFFKLLQDKVSGIGPKIALNILSRLSVPLLKQAIASGDIALLSRCPGIGKKTAERLIVELRDFLLPEIGGPAGAPPAAGPGPAGAGAPAASAYQDAVAALVALGYKVPDADKAVRKAQTRLGPDASTEALVRESLR